LSSPIASIDPTKTVDHYDRDDGDATHPIGIKYLVPAHANGIIRVTLSWSREPFRSTADLNPSSVAANTTDHNHSHSHTMLQDNGTNFPTPPNLEWWKDGGGNLYGLGAGGFDAVTFGNASGESATHSHALTGSGAQSVTDGPIATITALSLDGIDYTATLGGPWAGDIVEMDISAVFQKAAGAWHNIVLSLSGLGRVTSLLRIYYTS